MAMPLTWATTARLAILDGRGHLFRREARKRRLRIVGIGVEGEERGKVLIESHEGVRKRGGGAGGHGPGLAGDGIHHEAELVRVVLRLPDVSQLVDQGIRLRCKAAAVDDLNRLPLIGKGYGEGPIADSQFGREKNRREIEARSVDRRRRCLLGWREHRNGTGRAGRSRARRSSAADQAQCVARGGAVIAENAGNHVDLRIDEAIGIATIATAVDRPGGVAQSLPRFRAHDAIGCQAAVALEFLDSPQRQRPKNAVDIQEGKVRRRAIVQRDLQIANVLASASRREVSRHRTTSSVRGYLFSELSRISTSTASRLPGSALASPEARMRPAEPLALTV